MELSFEKKIITGFSIALFLIIGIGFVSYKRISESRTNSKLVFHTYEVIAHIQKVEKICLDAQAEARGFYLTGQARFLNNYTLAPQEVLKELNDLKSLTKDNPKQQANIENLKGPIKNLFLDTELKNKIQKEKGLDSIAKKVSEGEGKLIMDQIQSLTSAMIQQEKILLLEREKRTEKSIKQTIRTIILGTFIVIAIVALLTFYIKQTFLTRRKAEENLLKSNFELERLSRENEMKNEELQASEEELRLQQQELQESNVELEEKAQLLKEKNESLEQARESIFLKIKEIELTNKYKSEFLANMSHELRTPLNSLLIIAKLLGENKKQNLDEKQVEYSNIIYKSGMDLLNLINEILDLAKIESGKIELNYETIEVSDIENDLGSLFSEVAKSKSIEFTVKSSLTDKKILTDRQRLEQILKNLLANAFKFTPHNGTVTLEISSPEEDVSYERQDLLKKNEIVCFCVSDTGIGIPKDKHELIFEAFKQAEGSTSRKYGGTGLGLSISRELANLLGGEIQLKSEEGKGSTFTLYIPTEKVENGPIKEIGKITPVEVEHSLAESGVEEEIEVGDDKNNIEEKDKVILIIEDDLIFAKTLLKIAQKKGYKGIIATQGDLGLKYSKKYKPNAIILDMRLPNLDGWSILRNLKADEEVKNIPVHIMSSIDKADLGLGSGAVSYLTKPLTKTQLDSAFDKISKSLNGSIKNVLIVENNEKENNSICSILMLRQPDIHCFSVRTGEECLEILETRDFDCIVLDIDLKDMTGYALMQKIKLKAQNKHLPIIVYTSQEISQKDEINLRKYSDAIILKTNNSYQRLIDETTLFLHKVENARNKDFTIISPHSFEELLHNKTALVADDDMRNIYALSGALEENGLKVVPAFDGKDALEKLQENPSVDIVLMDIMMPEMDGYEAIKEIRKNNHYKEIPIIAITAKAMQEDREKCLEVGASDYITKPVNIEQLLSLMRVWLYK